MGERKRLFLLILIMTTVSLIVAGITIGVLYNTAFEEQRERLVETAQSQARLIEAVARFDALYSKGDFPGSPTAATLSQIADAHGQYKGFGETGEFTLARREVDNIVFLLRHRHYDLDKPKPVAFNSRLAEPMRRALSELSGSVVGLDYRGVTVLAAYEPVAELGLGIVAKIDLVEIRAPFVKAGITAISAALLVVLGGAVIFLRVINPIIRHLQERTAEFTVANEQLQHEIVERKQAEEALRESERRLKNAQRIAQVANWERDFETGEGYWSDEQYHLFGYEPNEIPDSHELFRKHLHPDDVPMVLEAIENSLASGTKFEIDVRYIPKDEELRYAHIICNVELDENGNPRWLHGTFQDITERRQAEEQLRFQAQLLNSVRESVVATDLKGHVIYWSRGAEKLYGYSSKEVIGKPITFIVEPHEEEEEKERMRQVFETGLWGGEYMQQCKNGSKFWADTFISLVKDKNEQPSGFIGIDRDITERKQAEEALHRAHVELELRVEERTAELVRANEKLRRSEEELRLLSSQLLTVQEEERRRIAADLHDSIGQYLNIIKLKTGEILRHHGNGMLELAGESCKTMATTIQDALDEVRRIYMDLRPSLLDDLGILVTIDWFCREFQEMHPGISIEKELSVEERQVPESLKIVIYRLLQEALNNIVRHSKADRVLVTVRRKDNTLELAIEDNGRGFDLEEELSVESSKRGLGLGTMRERTGLSGGSFSIETAKGTGTVVQASWQSQELESAKL